MRLRFHHRLGPSCRFGGCRSSGAVMPREESGRPATVGTRAVMPFGRGDWQEPVDARRRAHVVDAASPGGPGIEQRTTDLVNRAKVWASPANLRWRAAVARLHALLYQLDVYRIERQRSGQLGKMPGPPCLRGVLRPSPAGDALIGHAEQLLGVLRPLVWIFRQT